MSGKSERRAARETVAAYHEARLAELVQRVGEAIDRFRVGEVDAFDIDQVIPVQPCREGALEVLQPSRGRVHRKRDR